MMHADDLQAVSVDEALIDVTMTVNRLRETSKSRNLSGLVLQQYDPAKALAERIRSQVRESTGCESKSFSDSFNSQSHRFCKSALVYRITSLSPASQLDVRSPQNPIISFPAKSALLSHPWTSRTYTDSDEQRNTRL